MTTLNVERISDQSQLRSKRGHRKGWITKGEKFIEQVVDDYLEDMDIGNISRQLETLSIQKSEYGALQGRLVEVMETEGEDDSSIGKEADDLVSHSNHFDRVLSKLEELQKKAVMVHQMRKGFTTADRLLKEFEDRPDIPMTDLAAELVELKSVINKLTDAHDSLLATDKHHTDSIVEGLCHRFRAIKTRATREVPRVDASPLSASSPSISSITASDLLRSRLPDVTFPKFNGDKQEWPSFWRVFNQLLDKDTRMTEDDKVAYLKRSITTPEGTAEFKHLQGRPGDYDRISETLKKLYHNPRLVYRAAIESLIHGKLIDEADAREWERTLASVEREIESSGQDSARDILSVLSELRLTGKLGKQWAKTSAHQKKVPDLNDMHKYLEATADQYEASRDISHRSRSAPRPTETIPFKTKRQPAMYTRSDPSPAAAPYQPSASYQTAPYQQPSTKPKAPCKLCKVDRHAMALCPQFLTLSIPKRKEVVLNIKLCHNCLGYGHSLQSCRSSRRCRDCGQSHHSLLHETIAPASTASPPAGSPAAATVSAANRQPAYIANGSPSGGILPTAIINVQANGVILKVRAVLDRCSNVNFITNSVARRLQAVRRSSSMEVSGVGDETGLCTKECTDIVVFPKEISHDHPALNIQAQISESVSMALPLSSMSSVKQLPFLDGLELADPSFDAPGRVDMLLGLDATSDMFLCEKVSSPDRRYHAEKTIYGWIVVGSNPKDHTQAIVYTTLAKPPDNLTQFWRQEELEVKESTLSKDEAQAVSHFEETHTREADGRYVARLPRQIPTPQLGKSRQQAERRFLQNERSLKKKEQWPQFCKVVEEYAELNHAERVPAVDLIKPEEECYYLPMHGVVKDSTTTKLRVVFDASATTSNGISLNDTLLPGPNQYPLLTNMLVKFRLHKLGMTADISKMFREVGLHPADRDLHRFLWRDDNQQLQVWRMTRVTFGITSSPFLATQTIRQLADDYQEQFPAAAAIVRSEFYVDDCLSGADTVEQAVLIRRELNDLLGKAGMTLRKWRSNSHELRETIPEELCEIERDQTLIASGASHKTLGVHWNTELDIMHLSAPDLTTERKATKRQVSSDLAKTYDILGWFSPSLVIAKLLIQQLWVDQLGWDEPVPEDVELKWRQWTSELPLLTAHAVPRCYFHKEKKRLATQLHGFADASKVAFGAVAYMRAFYEDATTSVTLILSKTKVAPIKPISIPKLELCGALLLSRVLSELQQQLKIPSTNTYAWTDSTIVLGWLNHNPGRLKVYVANRVIAITEKVASDQWRHVPTECNPADAASRGLMPGELVASKIWWDGPEWLSDDPSQWPKHPQSNVVKLPEIKNDIVLLSVTPDAPWNLADHCPSLKRLLRTGAWYKRFAYNSSQTTASNRRSDPRLTTEELVATELGMVKHLQHKHYPAEFKALANKKEISTKSNLIKLHPFIGPNGALRVGGRLENSELPFSTKHPVILPKKERLTKLILQDIHDSNNHVGESTMMGLLSARYYVAGARALFRSITRFCIPCRKVHSRNVQQLMGQLPSPRTNLSAVFSHVGTDFAGPIITKSGNPRKPRKEKSYLCLFVCMATKAVHIEVVTSLSTSAFMAALHRFTSRRGLPEVIYSDNGTNFVGAENELREAYQLLQSKDTIDSVQRELSNSRVTWKHTPSRSPHFGGLWESTVKSIKTLLRKTVCNTTLTLEELSTVLCQVEASLNSRPLVPLDTLPIDGSLVLTPGHFLVGRPLRALPDMQSINPGSHLKRWNLCQQLTKAFWAEWSSVYLTSLNKLNKWLHPQRSLRVGDVVLIKDQELFVNTWPLGLVVDIHPGADGLVRAVSVKSQKGTYRRPAVKLTLLIPEDEKEPTSSPEDGRA